MISTRFQQEQTEHRKLSMYELFICHLYAKHFFSLSWLLLSWPSFMTVHICIHKHLIYFNVYTKQCIHNFHLFKIRKINYYREYKCKIVPTTKKYLKQHLIPFLRVLCSTCNSQMANHSTSHTPLAAVPYITGMASTYSSDCWIVVVVARLLNNNNQQQQLTTSTSKILLCYKTGSPVPTLNLMST